MSVTGAQSVVVAVDDAAMARDAVDTAVRIAAALDARVMALFLENADVLRAAALPFVRETGAVSGTVRAMPAAAILRTLRADAERVRSAVAAAARASGLAWQFEVVRASSLAVACAGREALDLLVLGSSAPHGLTSRRSNVRAVGGRVEAQPVAVALREVPGAAGALDAAQALAAGCNAPLLVLLCGADAGGTRRLRELARHALGGSPVIAEYLALPGWSVEAAVARARQHHARALVCCDGELRGDAQRLDLLLGRLRCPLVMTG